MAPGAIGILIYNNFYADINNNVMTKMSMIDHTSRLMTKISTGR